MITVSKYNNVGSEVI